MEPVVSSSLMMEHSAHRIRNALTGIYRYISPEDMHKNVEATYKRKVLDKLDAKKRAEYEQARRDKLTAEKNKKTPEQIQKMADAYRKEKDKTRKALAARHERDRVESLKRYDEETRRLKRGN